MPLSGFCGISYEILYAKLLGNLLGDRFTIAASVLLTFLLGIGLGTLYAYRLARMLWAIEIGIGLYAATLVLAYGAIDQLLYAWVPVLGTSILACALISVVLLLGPAFLVGCSVPLFAVYLGEVRKRHAFSLTYGLYNIGAALTALTMEFFIVRGIGLRRATLLLASLNVVVGIALLAIRKTVNPAPAVRQIRRRFGRRVLVALAGASVASAVFQLLMIKLAECVLGPFNETFALVLSIVLIGLAVGSWAAMKVGLTFDGAILVAVAGTGALLLLLPTWVGLYAALYPLVLQSYLMLLALKFGLVLAFMGVPAVGFGATIPALLTEYRNVARESGQLLFVSSMANVVRFVLMAFVLHRLLEYGQLLALVSFIAASALLLSAGLRGLKAGLAVALITGVLIAQRTAWDESMLYYGYKEFHSKEILDEARARRFSAEQFKGHHDLFAIISRDGNPYFFINGYISIALTAASEKIVGAMSTLFSPRTDEALVLGVGSGATAGTVGLLFDRTDAVEINRTVLDNLDRMEQYNFRLEHQSTVNLIHDDGIRFIKTTPKRYSLILNTVTSPLYFSSSKLYTRDFYELVADRLRPDGIYTTWIDRAIGDGGVDIILNTLDSVFDECWLTYIKSSYYLMVCSNEKIGLHQIGTVQENEILRDYLAIRHGLPLDFIPYNILSVDAFRFISQRTPVNTLDRPVLEHHMARLDSESRLFQLTDRLIDRSNLKTVERAVAPWFAWEPGGFLLWSDARLGRASLLRGAVDTIVERQFGDISAAYESAALDAARKTATAEAYEAFGRRLYRRELFLPAMDALAQALSLDASLYRAHYYLGRCHETRGEHALAATEFEEALRIRPDYEQAEKALVRVRSHEQSG
jgi:predicted membrane-bound spermidine synthase